LTVFGPAVLEAHNAAQELIWATKAKDLIGAYAVVEDLARRLH
jgi:hypothetical protein